ncbi:hypothetical protein BASA50_011142 [Batrachochytrium salamandrivorans]|uniref:Exonuclease domain-containing protein n=1 Tax=Batrachochytrium salamandrivorans TaxID=1357716 RepID=A0ABQ8EXH9_9FUNG|nr:hypothetical protein BASA62_004516 [Batrachochytrium salamandrivorans]KAH6582617.1 hypothetical protein BASA60_001862 [Batrachochytrium salamandrivorans]KAH6587751.1 hypothetical protein BASA50_011142 [Batrachochytrium salamandrivorans]KAH6593372.1 hypothetical protein BASA61_004318 [Batrachochytrium salamandrivorans]KAH9272021.1 hypothetical protein BASA83_005867 [Batrachochytrium salamandrivorans]
MDREEQVHSCCCSDTHDGICNNSSPIQVSATPHVDELRRKLQQLGVDVDSTTNRKNKTDLIKQLKRAQRKAKTTQETLAKSVAQVERDARRQPFSIYLVCDIEATCAADSAFDFANEVIEFPVIAISGTTMQTTSTFRRYCRPLLNPILTEFCTNLTGITQAQVDAADPFPVVFKDFLDWVSTLTDEPSNLDKNDIIFVTDGPWDLRDFMEKEFTYCSIERPIFMRKIINIRSLYVDVYALPKTNLNGMLEGLGMVFEGREHCGMDDAANVARILRRIDADGHRIERTSDINKKASKGSWRLLRK